MSKKKKVLMMVLAALIGLLLLACAAFYVVFDVPNWQQLDASKLSALAQTSSMYDAQGELMSELRGAENRNIVSLDEIPMHTRQAFLAAEDLRFYEHRGIDVYRILGALRSNIKNGTLAEGASTITQQLAKLTHLSAEKTIRRKLEEIHLAFQIEAAYSKDEILAMYLNTVYFGRGAYGIQAAAQAYFGVDVSALTLNQSASLAAIIKAPSVYAPHISPSSNRSRRQYILSVMEDNGFITQEEARKARGESVWVLAREAEKQSYGWYIDEALRESAELLGLSADEVIRGGFEIHTAYDARLQTIADEVYSDQSFFPADASDGTPIQSAMAVVDTGPALELGYTTASVLLDEKTSFGNYTPRNAGDRYYGLVTMRTAVRNSLNTTAVRLLEEIGVNASIQYLNKMGIPTEKSDRNLSLALGSMTYGVTPVELAAAYAPYANGGVYHQPYCVSRIESADGNIVYERKESGKQVISAQNAFLMTSLLQSVVSNGTGTRMLAANTPIAGKTGTVSMTGGNRDIWMAAYTPEISVSVWMGFDQTDAKHKISNGVTGGRNTASLAAAFFKKAYTDRDKPNFNQPDGLIWLTLDKRALTSRGSVMLASDKTPKEYRVSEVFAASNRPYAVSDIWQAPNAPSSFYVAHSAGGYPELHFKASSDARYRIQRDAVGESVILTEMVASSGQALSFLDTSAQVGVLYTYRIIPIHEELLQQGVWLEGKQAVQLAQVQAGSGMISGLRSLIPALAAQRK